MRIAIIGAGHVGATLGQGFTRAGHQVVFGTRRAGAEAPYPGAEQATVRVAVERSDLAVLAVPWSGVEEALAAAGDLGGRPLVDVTNPIAPGLTLALGHTTSGAERVASLARGARVVKAFNITGVENMADPRYGHRRAFLPLAGDDREAVERVAALATDLGFEAVALPGLAHARELEPLAILWIKLATQWGHGRSVAFGLARRDRAGEAVPRRSASPRSITVVGSGNIGGALARAWLGAGHRVTIAARDPASEEVRALVGLGATAVPVAGAAASAEVVVLAIPAGAAVETARSLGPLGGKVVVDCTNAIASGFTLQYGHTTSSAEELARQIPEARLVRAFHQQGAEVLRDPRFGGLPAASFVASDDAAARALVRQLSDDVGLDSVEVGPLASARLLEPITLLWVALSRALGTRELGLTLLRR